MIMEENFFQNVYEVVKLIPKGRATSYGLIGQYLGMKSGARMVGWAMNAAHGLPDVPAHRVVNAQGLLTGKMHFATPDMMEELLLDEGVVVKNDKIQEYKSKVLWNPNEELL